MDQQLAPHQERVVAEHRELTERLNKLVAFSRTPQFIGLHVAERSRLQSQARHMSSYAAVLEERIVAFSV